MKSIYRFTALLALVFLALSPAVAVNGQALPCDGLADADCKLLQDAINAGGMAKLSSFTADYSLNATIAGTYTDDGDIKLNGSGPFALDPAAIAAIQAGNADIIGVITAGSGLTMDNSVKLEGSFAGPQAGNYALRSVGGNLYFKADSIAQGKWLVLNLGGAMGFIQNYLSLSIQNAMQSITPNNPAGANIVSDPKLQADLGALIKMPGAFKAEATDGPTVDGQATRKLTYTLDVVAVAKSEELKTMVMDAVTAAGNAGEAEQAGASIDPVAIQEVLKDSKFQITWLVGSNDKLLHNFDIMVVVKVEPTFVDILTNTSDSKEFNGNFELNIQISKIGQPVKVDPVADAQMPDIFSFFGGAQATPAPTATQ